MILYANPNAKINIGLFIKGKRSDGYHAIETLFYPVFELCDTLSIAPLISSELSTIQLSGKGLPTSADNNLCIKAWELFRAAFGSRVSPVSIRLHKNIPPGAGLGGGSSDAAATLLLLNQLFTLDLSIDELKQFARKLGADVPFFIENRPLCASGIGEELIEPDFDVPQCRVKIMLSDIFSDTTAAYRALQPNHWSSENSLFDYFRTLVPQAWHKAITNDFEKVVFQKYPQLEMAKAALYAEGAFYASMSGSGSAVFGLFA